MRVGMRWAGRSGTMWTPYLKQGGEIQEHPEFRHLSDTALRARLGARVRSVGGRVGSVLIDQRPTASFPSSTEGSDAWVGWRLFHYDEGVRQTVAVVLKKELIGYRLVQRYERQQQRAFHWLLLLREDAHFFAPLNLSAFAPHAVHGKGCGRYGGWNDHVYLIWRGLAGRMLSSYHDLHTPRLALAGGISCWLGERAGRLTGGRAWAATREWEADGVPIDLLACATAEQWRARDSVLCGSLCFMFLVLIHQVSAVHQTGSVCPEHRSLHRAVQLNR